MANALENPLMASNELSYDFSGFDVDMNDLYEQNANKGQTTHPVWDDESGQAHELKNFIELTKDRECLLDVGGNIGFMSLSSSSCR